MFGFGPWEIAVLAMLTVFVFGWRALPKLFRGLRQLHGTKAKLAEELRQTAALLLSGRGRCAFCC